MLEAKHPVVAEEKRGCIVNGDVVLSGQIVPRLVRLSHFTFLGAVTAAGATFEKAFIVNHSVFYHPVDLRAVIAHGPISFEDAVFTVPPPRDGSASDDTSLVLSQTTIDGGLYLKRSSFQAPVNADGMTINGPLHAPGSKFFDPERVSALDLTNSIVAGSVNLKRAQIDPALDFTNLLIHGSLDMTKAAIVNDPLNGQADCGYPGGIGDCRLSSLAGLRVEGIALFDRASFGCVSLDGASFGALNLQIHISATTERDCNDFVNNRRVPEIPLSVVGLAYTRIIGGPQAVEHMAKLIDKYVGTDQAPVAFTNLESAAASIDSQSADSVFIRAQWWEVGHGPALRPWQAGDGAWRKNVAQWVNGQYVEFGRRPLKALLFWTIFVVLGAIVFVLLFRRISACVYSVTCFLPSDERRLDISTFSRLQKGALVAYVLVGIMLFGTFVYFMYGGFSSAILSVVAPSLALFYGLFRHPERRQGHRAVG